jgi:hypothetical protein
MDTMELRELGDDLSMEDLSNEWLINRISEAAAEGYVYEGEYRPHGHMFQPDIEYRSGLEVDCLESIFREKMVERWIWFEEMVELGEYEKVPYEDTYEYMRVIKPYEICDTPDDIINDLKYCI